MSRSFRLLKLVGAACLLYVASTLDWARLWRALDAVDGGYLAAACGINLLAAVLKAYRWKILVAAQSGSISFVRCLFAHIHLTFVAMITPGRLGDLFKLKYLREVEFGTVKAATNLLLDRASDLVMMASLGLAAAIFQTPLRLDVRLLAALALLGLGSILLVRLVHAPLLGLLNPQTRTVFEGFAREVSELDLFYLSIAVLSTLAGVLAIALQLHLIAIGLGVEVGFLTFLPIILAGNLVALLPLSIAGLGTRELVLITLLGRHGVPPEVAALISFIDVFLISYAFRGVLSLMVGTFKKQLLPDVA